MMRMRDRMVKELFDKLGPNEDQDTSIFLSYDGVTNLYKVSENHVGGVGGGEDLCRNTISRIRARMGLYWGTESVITIHQLPNWRGSEEQCIYFQSLGQETTSDIPELVSGFVISPNGHTTATDMGGSQSEKLTPNG
ncbi:hypothetical protein Tco_0787515 [Tanacetum coccineum]